jgi:hypothetical protein
MVRPFASRITPPAPLRCSFFVLSRRHLLVAMERFPRSADEIKKRAKTTAIHLQKYPPPSVRILTFRALKRLKMTTLRSVKGGDAEGLRRRMMMAQRLSNSLQILEREVGDGNSEEAHLRTPESLFIEKAVESLKRGHVGAINVAQAFYRSAEEADRDAAAANKKDSLTRTGVGSQNGRARDPMDRDDSLSSSRERLRRLGLNPDGSNLAIKVDPPPPPPLLDGACSIEEEVEFDGGLTDPPVREQPELPGGMSSGRGGGVQVAAGVRRMRWADDEGEAPLATVKESPKDEAYGSEGNSPTAGGGGDNWPAAAAPQRGGVDQQEGSILELRRLVKELMNAQMAQTKLLEDLKRRGEDD